MIMRVFDLHAQAHERFGQLIERLSATRVGFYVTHLAQLLKLAANAARVCKQGAGNFF